MKVFTIKVVESSFTGFTGGTNSTLEDLEIYKSTSSNTLTGISNFTNLSALLVRNAGLTNINGIASSPGIVFLDVCNNSISNIDGLRGLKNLTTLNLSNNAIADLSPLLDTISYNGESDKIGTTTLSSINIRTNVLDGYSVANNVDVLLRFHKAGLDYVYLGGNNFTESDIADLYRGKEIEINNEKINFSGFLENHLID